MKLIIYLYCIFIVILFIGCTSIKKSSKEFVFDYLEAADSLKMNIIDKDGDYIYFYRSLSPYNRTVYLIQKDSAIIVYKINRSGIFIYNSPYWYIEVYGELSRNFQIILNDRIEIGEFALHHSPWFLLECRLKGNTFRKEGGYYQLKHEQPLNLFITKLERDLLNAEQDVFFWEKK